MPLDGHSYLVAQGWGGKGTGLRDGAISRPLAIAQKKNLAGLGKDRDEAFPFWDHLFSAAAKSIQVKCMSDDEDTDPSSSTEVTLTRTSTGIFSTRRPIEGTPATSGVNTPNIDESESQPLRLSLMANAKRDAAKKGLYSRFFRGPVIGPETIAAEEKRLASLVSEAFKKQHPEGESGTVSEHIEVQTVDQRAVVDIGVSCSKSSHKKRKAAEQPETPGQKIEEDEDERRERKRRRKEEKQQQKQGDKTAKSEKHRKGKKDKTKGKQESTLIAAADAGPANVGAGPSNPVKVKKAEESNLKAERKRRKEEKKIAKLGANIPDIDAAEDRHHISETEKDHPHLSKEVKRSSPSRKKPSRKKRTPDEGVVIPEENEVEPKKRKKRKRTHEGSELN